MVQNRNSVIELRPRWLPSCHFDSCASQTPYIRLLWVVGSFLEDFWRHVVDGPAELSGELSLALAEVYAQTKVYELHLT